ncbi:MAG: hypothetical protein DCC75_06205, partial [Proteobacteria bacterium]
TKAMEGWFSSQVEAAVGGALEVARQHYALRKQQAESIGKQVAERITKIDRNSEKLPEVLNQQRLLWNLYSLKVLGADKELLAEASNAASVIENFSEPVLDADAPINARQGQASVTLEEKNASQYIRSYEPITWRDSTGVLVSTIRVSPELSQALNQVNDSFRGYEQLKILRSPLKSGYILTLSMITGLLLFSAIWLGFYIAKEMVVPLQRLGEGFRYVAQGRYDFQIRDVGDDELGVLVKSFNQMIADLKSSRGENESKRVFIETILTNLAVGVVAIDSQRRLTSINPAGRRILGLTSDQSYLGRPLAHILKSSELEQISPVFDAVQDSESEGGGEAGPVLERQVSIQAQGRELKVVCTAGKIRGARGESLGTVLLLDDITELSRVQHLAAWREVAQRIAHEIKNPLTPIQLSAQRLAKIVGENVDSSQPAGGADTTSKLLECSQTIVENVSSIKRLANEFSNFARMPHADFQPSSLNSLISTTIAPFAASHSDIVFQFIADNEMPDVFIDQEQIRRIIINLIDNAIQALNSSGQLTERKLITIRSYYDRRKRLASFEVVDNGPGIKAADRARIFEPYFTTRKGGTGLGLAIVSSIISDHQGDVRVYENQPRGTKFIIDLPVAQRTLTQRRFAS